MGSSAADKSLNEAIKPTANNGGLYAIVDFNPKMSPISGTIVFELKRETKTTEPTKTMTDNGNIGVVSTGEAQIRSNAILMKPKLTPGTRRFSLPGANEALPRPYF